MLWLLTCSIIMIELISVLFEHARRKAFAIQILVVFLIYTLHFSCIIHESFCIVFYSSQIIIIKTYKHYLGAIFGEFEISTNRPIRIYYFMKQMFTLVELVESFNSPVCILCLPPFTNSVYHFVFFLSFQNYLLLLWIITQCQQSKRYFMSSNSCGWRQVNHIEHFW